MKYLYDPPAILKNIFSSFIWNTACDKVLFTFDDGPNPITTEIILRELDRHKIKAAFFCVGINVKKNPTLIQMMNEQGHLIANHTFNHAILTHISDETAADEILNTNLIIENITGKRPDYFRPPHGRFKFNTGKMLKKYGLKNVMWSCLTFDYKNDINIVNFAIRKYLRHNSIVVLHDRIKNKEIITDSISFLVDEINRKGFEIGKPEECLN